MESHQEQDVVAHLSPKDSAPTRLSPSDHGFFSQGAYLLKKTEISIESTPAELFSDEHSSDRASTCSTTRADKRRLRNLLGTHTDRESEESSSIWRSSEDLNQPFESLQFGTKVSIEAAQPVKDREQQFHEMKGLQQAASMRRWAGEGRPAEAWGKLMKDPELWDCSGDTLVYFGYQRPQASFRVKASLLEDTKSEILNSKLQEGFQRTAKVLPSHTNTSSLRGMKNLGLAAKGRRQMPTLAEHDLLVNENSIRHEIHFPAPDNASRLDILRHHITTRNFFAFLLSKPLVGLTLYQALTDLHERLYFYMTPDVNCTEIMIQYMTKNGLHQVTNDPAAAAGLLSWSEKTDVLWQEGWREAFVHCVGMYNNLRGLPELRDVSHGSRTLLELSHLELQARIEDCQHRFSAFNFDDLWLTSIPPSSLPRRSFDNFREFLRRYYERAYKSWPPASSLGSGDYWLTRELTQRLQNDFACLYEYLVDRHRLWDKSSEKSPDDDILSLTKILLLFDKKHEYPHIPHPYPLLPNVTAEMFEGKQPKSGFFSSKAKTTEKKVVHACAEASNATRLQAEVTNNSLLAAFLRFQKSDLVTDVNPQEVRQGRWILLYGILQVLSTLSVDTPGLWFTDVPYFLNARLSGHPPWRSEAEEVPEEANPKLGHCWTVPKK